MRSSSAGFLCAEQMRVTVRYTRAVLGVKGRNVLVKGLGVREVGGGAEEEDEVGWGGGHWGGGGVG